MRNETLFNHNSIFGFERQQNMVNAFKPESESSNSLPEILFLTSYPPRECGKATYSKDLVEALKNKFQDSFKISICALESDTEKHSYGPKVKYNLNTDEPGSFAKLADKINQDKAISMVMVQHEFGIYN
jgi:hypothetical protein